VTAEVLAQRRKSCGLTLRAVASISGLSFSYISQLEMGDANPTLETIMRLAGAYKIKPCLLVREIDHKCEEIGVSFE